jgi:D-alanyl-D-alanine carboxypeptidase/D-alanyl-D-alanine-endopeptidase (penicillin-binding protein 4)
MYAGSSRDDWVSLLPIGGKDGTLYNRMVDTAAAGRIFAKTGSLSHVSALSGYAKRNDGTWVMFAIMVNNYNARAAEVRGVMDRICNLIVE